MSFVSCDYNFQNVITFRWEYLCQDSEVPRTDDDLKTFYSLF